MHEEFPGFVKRTWRHGFRNSSWFGNINHFSNQVKPQNKEVFSCLWRRKVALKKKLDSINARRGTRFNSYLDLECKRV